MHGLSIVIGAFVEIGKNATIYQNVTIGGGAARLYKDRNIKQPHIGDNFNAYAGSTILGGIYIGNDVTIAARALITKDIVSNLTVLSKNENILK